MHTGEPLFGGADQVDQMSRIVDVLGMPPYDMIDRSPDKNKNNFFLHMKTTNFNQARASGVGIPSECDTNCTQFSPDGSLVYILKRPPRDTIPPKSLAQIIGVDSGGPFGRRRDEAGHTRENYTKFLNFIV